MHKKFVPDIDCRTVGFFVVSEIKSWRPIVMKHYTLSPRQGNHAAGAKTEKALFWYKRVLSRKKLISSRGKREAEL